MTFADRFEALRTARGWSPSETARQIGVSESQVGRWRKGYGGIQLHMVYRVADVFGADRAEMAALAGYGDPATDRRSRDAGLAAFLDQLQKSLGLSGADFARRIGVAQSQVSRWRKGEGGVSQANLERIASEFSLDITMLRRLAGYDSSPSTTTVEGIDPTISALVDADRAELRGDLEGVPPVFWATVINARRQAGKAVAEAVARVSEEAQRSAIPGEISRLAGESISSAPPRPRRERTPRSEPRADDISKCFPVAVAA